MQIVDDLIEPELAAECRQWLLNQNLVFGWKAHARAPGVFWHRNFVLPGKHNHHYDAGAWQPERTFDAFVAQGGPLARVALRVKDQFFPNAEITRLWVNVQAFGDEASLHRDFPAEFQDTARSVIWYPVAEWSADWGGIWWCWTIWVKSRRQPWSSPIGWCRSMAACAMLPVRSPAIATPCVSRWRLVRRWRHDRIPLANASAQGHGALDSI